MGIFRLQLCSKILSVLEIITGHDTVERSFKVFEKQDNVPLIVARQARCSSKILKRSFWVNLIFNSLHNMNQLGCESTSREELVFLQKKKSDFLKRFKGKGVPEL